MAGASKGRKKMGNSRLMLRAPNRKAEEESDLLSQLRMAVRQDNVIIIVYFSLPDIDWADRTAQSFKACHFLNFLQDNFMCQLVDALT